MRGSLRLAPLIQFFLLVIQMGRHSIEKKKIQRKAQKKKKRLAHKQAKSVNYSDSAGDSETSSDSDSSSLSVPSSPDNVSATLPSVEPHPQFYENTPHSGSALSTPPNRFHSGDRYVFVH